MLLKNLARKVSGRIRQGTSLDRLIPPEIRNDSFYSAIVRVAATPGVEHMLEIGSSGGDGSTEAFIEGALMNPSEPTLHCIEISDVRYQGHSSKNRHASRGFVRCYHASSVPLEKVASEAEVTEFYHSVPSVLNDYSLKTVLGRRAQDVRYMKDHGLVSNGIRDIKNGVGLDLFDAVLIDGSEFTGSGRTR